MAIIGLTSIWRRGISTGTPWRIVINDIRFWLSPIGLGALCIQEIRNRCIATPGSIHGSMGVRRRSNPPPSCSLTNKRHGRLGTSTLRARRRGIAGGAAKCHRRSGCRIYIYIYIYIYISRSHSRTATSDTADNLREGRVICRVDTLAAGLGTVTGKTPGLPIADRMPEQPQRLQRPISVRDRGPSRPRSGRRAMHTAPAMFCRKSARD